MNDITASESISPTDTDFNMYKGMAFLYLNHKGKYLFADEMLSKYKEGMTLEKLFDQEGERFVPGSNHQRNDKIEPTWYDVWGMTEIKRNDRFFDYFFNRKLRQLMPLEIADFLNFQLDYSFQQNKAEFLYFLEIILIQDHPLSAPLLKAVTMWMQVTSATKEQEHSTNAKDSVKIKGRITREPGDGLTSLNQNQIALLAQFMQQAGIILKGEYLTYTQAGKALSLLTGYSADTLRQQLGTKGEVEGVKFEDYKELKDALLRMVTLIDKKLPKK